MSLKMECHFKLNVAKNLIPLRIECHTNGIQVNMECLSKWNVTQNGMSFKMECP